MREFGKRSRLAMLPLSARLVYTVFLAFTLVGLAVSAWLGETLVGLELERFDEYYAGVSVTPPSLDAPSEGPALDLPPEVVAAPLAEPKSFRATLEVTHFHLFTMPIHWLVLAHLFALCAIAERWKAVFITGSAIAMGTHLIAPWVARSGGGLARVFYAGSGGLLVVTFGWMAVSALSEMWRPR